MHSEESWAFLLFGPNCQFRGPQPFRDGFHGERRGLGFARCLLPAEGPSALVCAAWGRSTDRQLGTPALAKERNCPLYQSGQPPPAPRRQPALFQAAERRSRPNLHFEERGSERGEPKALAPFAYAEPGLGDK